MDDTVLISVTDIQTRTEKVDDGSCLHTQRLDIRTEIFTTQTTFLSEHINQTYTLIIFYN